MHYSNANIETFSIKFKQLLIIVLYISTVKTKDTLTTSITIESNKEFNAEQFLQYTDLPELQYCGYGQDEERLFWFFARQEISTTCLMVARNAGTYELHIDNLAAYDDLRIFPYIADSLAHYLNGKIAGIEESLYNTFGEEWAEETISEEIAILKGTLSIVRRYYISLPMNNGEYISLKELYPFGVNLHSSTPRIYGYLQYMMRNGILPCGEPYSEEESEQTVEVDIPQHVPVGRVKSWQTDGSETYETYSQEDIEHLLALAGEYKNGRSLHGVVLNDIGTLYHEGAGIPADAREAVFWFEEACKAGDTIYAPTNLGDLYRKGCGSIGPSLADALAAYRKSSDPYAHFRIGQSYEEGWTSEPDIRTAFKWYELAAKEGHHLAIKRLEKEKRGSKP